MHNYSSQTLFYFRNFHSDLNKSIYIDGIWGKKNEARWERNGDREREVSKILWHVFFITLLIFNLRQQIESTEAGKKVLKQLESSNATVELFKKTEEKMVFKRSDNDLEPLELTVNKKVRQIRDFFKRYINSENIPGFGRLFE